MFEQNSGISENKGTLLSGTSLQILVLEKLVPHVDSRLSSTDDRLQFNHICVQYGGRDTMCRVGLSVPAETCFNNLL